MKEPISPDYSKLPSMTSLLEAAANDQRFDSIPRPILADALRAAVDQARKNLAGKIGDASDLPVDVEQILNDAALHLTTESHQKLRPVINATGIVLHTGLGRSTLPPSVADRVRDAAANYCNIELDLDSGKRGQRGAHVETLLCKLTGAEAALVVNNNAAATMLALAALGRNREVIVSRGQLIEIGGSYRLPDVMSAGGALLREVGTTNKTRLSDYDAAVNEQSAMLMHVHTSNYRVVGFSDTPGVEELAQLAKHHNLPLFDDIGSGALRDDSLWATADEPTVEASLKAGATIAAFSGDKLLGGPQAGILLGEKAVIERLRKHPMARALRVCKLTLSALEAILELYQDGDRAKLEIPTLAMLSEPVEAIRGRATAFAKWLQKNHPSDEIELADDETYAGGGSLPARPLTTVVVRWRPKSENDLESIARQLRIGSPSVLCRINVGSLVFDFRTVKNEEVELLRQAVGRIETC